MASTRLNQFPEPFLRELVEGRWLPIVGAGLSLNAVLAPGKKMPLWDDLGRSIAREMRDYDYAGALDAISAYAHQFSRPKLVERFIELLFITSARPGAVHKAFCSINFPVVCTTNFDFLLEKQYDAGPRYCRPIIHEDQLSIPNTEPGVLLLKLHGDVHHPERLIATEEDYDGFVQRQPLISTYLANLLITKTAVFIGYSLDDPDLRQIFQLIKDRLGKSRRLTYAIRVAASTQEVARFERRGVRVINLPGPKSKYAEILAETFEELRRYQEAAVIPASQVTDERALREFQLPSGATTRICYFSVPFALSSRYKDALFPIADRYGFVPITADTVVSPGDSVASKIEAVIGRASIAVVDSSSDWTSMELRIALSKMAPQRVLTIVDKAGSLPIDLRQGKVLVRPAAPFSENDEFLQEVEQWFENRSKEVEPSLNDEPERLLSLGSPRAAIVAAVTLLETELRRRLNLATSSITRPMSLRQLTALADERQLLRLGEMEDVRNWMSLRNAAVHGATPAVSPADARRIVAGVRQLVEELKRR